MSWGENDELIATAEQLKAAPAPSWGADDEVIATAQELNGGDWRTNAAQKFRDLAARTQPQSPEWWAQRRQESALADADQMAAAPAIIREPYYGVAGAAAGIASTVARPFSKETADFLTEQGQRISSESEAARKDDWSPWLSRMYGGAAQSLAQAAVAAPLGSAGIIGSFALTEGNQALYDAEQAGLKGMDRIKYAVIQGGIEGAIAGAFQLAGLGGQEKFIADLAKGVMKTSGKQFLKMTLQELPEELMTEFGHAITESFSGVSPDAMNSENFWPRMRDTVAQTMMTLGLTQATATVAQLRQKANDLDVMTGKGFVTQQEAEKIGLTPEQAKNRESRKKAVEEQKRQIEQQAQELEQQIPPVDKVPSEGDVFKSPGGGTFVFRNGAWTPQIEKEPSDASRVPRDETEIREEPSGEDVRGEGKEQVRAEPAGEGAPSPEVPVAESEFTATPESQKAFERLRSQRQEGDPPIPEGMTRLYHGSATEGRYTGPAWYSTNREYAANYRPDAELQYVDVPTDWAIQQLDPDGYGTPASTLEIQGDEFGPRKPISVPQSPREKAQQKQAPAEPFQMPPDEVQAAKEVEAIRRENKRKGRRDQVVSTPPQATTQTQQPSEAEKAPEAAQPLQTQQEAAQEPEKAKKRGRKDEGRQEVMLAAGETATTSSGRQTSPFPKVDTSSGRKAENTVKRVDKWLWENAIAEARSRGDEWNLRLFENEDPARLPPATKDSMNEYLFGEQPDVVPKATKRPVRKSPPLADVLEPSGVAERASQEATEKFEPVSTPPRVTEKDEARRTELWEQAATIRERERQLEKQKEEIQKKHDATRRNAHKKRGEFQKQIRALGTEQAANARRRRKLEAEARLMSIEDALESPASELHRLAGVAELQSALASREREIVEEEEAWERRERKESSIRKTAEEKAKAYSSEAQKHYHNLRVEAERLAKAEGLVVADEVSAVAERAIRDFSVTSRSSLDDLVKAEVKTQRRLRADMSMPRTQYLSKEQRAEFEKRFRDSAEDDAKWYEKQAAVKKEMIDADEAARREHEAGAAERARVAAEEAKVRAKEEAIEGRKRRQEQAANDRYFRQARERAKALKGTTEKRPLSKSGEPQGAVTNFGKWSIDEKTDAGKGEGKYAVIHAPSGEEAVRAGTMADAKLFVQMVQDAQVEIADDPKATSESEQKRWRELVQIWDTGYLGTSDLGKHLAGMVEVPDAGVTGDIVLDASDLIRKGETEIPQKLKDFINELPEFAYNPVFTVNEDRNLVFKDGYKFSFSPSFVGLDDSLVEPGQTVALNLRDVGIERPAPEEVVKAVLEREFEVKKGGKKQGGLLLKRFGSKTGDRIVVSGGGHNWNVTSGTGGEDAKRAQKLLDGIPWTRKEQIAKNEAASEPASEQAQREAEEGEGIASFAPQNPTRMSRSSKRKAEGTEERIAAADIQKTAERLFGVAIRQGGFSNRAAGIYKWLTRSKKSPPSPEVVRTGEAYYASLGVIAHEIAHHIDEKTKAVKGMPQDVRDEIKRLDYEPQKGRAFEGWAEFLRRYMTEPAIDVNGTDVPNPGIDAPKTLAWFEGTFLPANAKVAEAVAEFRQYAQQWAQQSVFQRLGTLIADRQPQDLSFKEEWLRKQKRFVHRLKTNFVDKFHTLEWIQEKARQLGHKGIGIYDLTMAYFMSASSHATIAFEEGVKSLQTGKPIGTTSLWGLRDHLESDGEYEDANLYALARHTLFMAEKKPGYSTVMDVEDAQAWIEEVEAEGKTDRFEKYAQGIATFANDLLIMLVDAGALPADQAQNMLRYYGGRNYFPLYRVRDAEHGMFTGTGVGFVNLGKAVKGRSAKGSGRQIIDPIDALVQMGIKFYGRAIQARQQHVLAETLDPKLGGVGGMGGLMDRVDPKKKVTHGTIDEILGTLVDEGVVDADDAKAMRIAAKILNPEFGVPGEKSLAWFAERHGIEGEEIDIDSLMEAAGQEPDAMAVISLWRPDYTPNASKRTVVIYDKQGKPLMYEMDPDLYATATGMDELQFGPFMSTFREAARWFKTGAVGASTGFGTANLLRDYWEFQGKSRHAKGLQSLGKPPVMLGRYIAEKARKLAGHEANDRLIRLYEESGGKVYSVIGHDVQSRRRYRRRRMGKSVMSKLGIAMERPGDSAESVLQGMMDVIAISDAPPRLADAEAAIREEGFEIRDGNWFDINANKTVDHLPEHVRIKAAVAMAEATINFKRVGAKGQYIESFMPFFNASVQGAYRQYQQMKSLKSLGKKDVEGARAARYMVYLSALAATGVAYWLLRHDDDDWREQEAYLRDGYWTWGRNGKTYVRIPKPRDTAVISNIVENMLDAWYHDDARDTSDVLLRDFGGRMPTGGGFIRGAIETFVADYDYFRDRELTPDYLKDLPKEQQITPYTSRASDAIGQFTGRYLGTSPIQVEHLLNSASGGFYHRMTNLYDSSVDGRLGPEHLPFVRGLVIDRHQARSVSDFYRKRDEARTEEHREAADTGKVSDETTRQRGVMDGHAELMTAIRELEGKVGKKRDYKYQPYIVGLARAALGYDELKNNPNPLTDKNAPDAIKEIVSKYSQRVILQATEKLKEESEYKDKESYETERKSRIRGDAKLKAIGVTLEEAEQILESYYQTDDPATKKDESKISSDENKSLKAKLERLAELYSE